MKPCTHVTFRHPAEVVDDEYGGILLVRDAQWFAALLHRVPDLEIEDLQEDWGVMWFARRNGKEFWMGLSFWDEGCWIAHFHHGGWVPWRWPTWFQPLSSSGKNEFKRLLADVHEVLVSEPAISDIGWSWKTPERPGLHPLVNNLIARRYNSLPPPQVWRAKS